MPWIRGSVRLLICCALSALGANAISQGAQYGGSADLDAALAANADVASLRAQADGELPSLIELYKGLHARPELSYKEEKTSALVARELRLAGFEVTEQVGKYGDPGKVSYGVVGVLKNGPGPTLLLRAELDALPVAEKTGLPYASKEKAANDAGESVGVMHACGHDLHMASFVGAARLLARLKERWSGTLVLVAEPAEEAGAGSLALLSNGLYQRFPRPDYAFALHSSPELPAGKLGFREGFFFANAYNVDVLVRGRGGHGAAPQFAKDPVVLAAQLVLALQTLVSRENSPLDPAVLTVGSIRGGTKHNVIPDEVRLQLSLRSYKTEVAERMIAGIRRVAKGLAEAAGLPQGLEPVVEPSSRHTPAIFNDPSLTRRLAASFKGLLGEGAVVETEPVMLADDFARYALEGKVPIAMFWLGTVGPDKKPPLPALHSAEFAPEPKALRTGAEALVTAVLTLLSR